MQLKYKYKACIKSNDIKFRKKICIENITTKNRNSSKYNPWANEVSTNGQCPRSPYQQCHSNSMSKLL